jgi:hypothetical protein
MKTFDSILERLDTILFERPDMTLLFVTHFPVVKVGEDWKGSHEMFAWASGIDKELQTRYNKNKIMFLNGHAHQQHMGPVRYEAGSDYYLPKFIIINV